jgi:hypothetical protein
MRRAFALCLSGRDAEARALRPEGALDADGTTLWNWIADCGSRQ